MLPGKAALNGLLTLDQPVHGFVEQVFVDLFCGKPEFVGEGAGGGLGCEAPNQLGRRLEDACRDHACHEVALGRAAGGDDAIDATVSQAAENSCGMPVRQRANDIKGVRRGSLGCTLEEGVEGIDDMLGQPGKIGESALSGFSVLTERFAQEDGRRRATIWDAVYETWTRI